MNPALINLLVFLLICLLGFLAYKLFQARSLPLNAQKRQKNLTEDILKQLFHVEQSTRQATLSDLSGALKVRKTTILPLIEAATSSGLLTMKEDILELTAEGREYALRIVRVHRLWEKYLAERTGHNPSDWHYLAEKMEHKLNADDTAKLSSMLGDPLFDPHGDPIPGTSGELKEVEWLPLPSYPVNTPGKIVHIEDEPGVIYQQILAKRILVGSHFIITESSNNKVVFTCEGQEHQFSSIVAANIHVIAFNEEEVYEADAVRLSALNEGESAKVVGLSQECRGANRRRLLDLGILPGTKISVDLNSPMRNPIAYRVRNTSIALRNELADLILINKTT